MSDSRRHRDDHRARAAEPALSTALLEQVGWTGLLIAGLRADESRRPDALVDDPFATALVDLLGDEGNAGATQWTARGGRASEMATALREYVAVRTRYIDDAVTAGVEAGLRQVVLLGAGLDGRARRMSWPDGTTIHEVDTPDVLSAKDRLAERIGLPSRAERHGVPVDLRDDWPAALAAHGHRADRPTLWILEGLLYYLSREQDDALMTAVATVTAPGSRLVTEYPDVDMASFFGLIGRAADTQHTAGFVRSGPEEAPALWLPRSGWGEVAAVPLVEELARHGRPAPPWALRSDGATWWLATASRVES